MMHSPYGDISQWVSKKNVDRYDYAYKVQFEADGFKPLSAWMIVNAFGDRVYFKARDRATAQRLCDELLGEGKYTVIPDKVVR